jgi:hypothetical protein
MTAKCGTCRFWQQTPNAKEGICGYAAPPVVRAVYDMLHAEPATHINWRLRMSEPFLTAIDDRCSEHKPEATS